MGHEVFRVAKSSKSADVMADLTDEKEIGRILALKPDVVVNAVKPALSVDEMETRRKEAYALNTLLPERLAARQEDCGYLLVQISTDGVYPGKEGETYTEESRLGPPNYYCMTKALAEERIIRAARKYLILRTEGVFGHDEKGTNFFMRMMRAEAEGKPFHAASDQFSQPICGIELARLAKALVEKKAEGVYNACGKDYVSRHALACEIKARMGWRLEIRKSSIADRAVPVQPHLRVDVSKIEGVAGAILPLGGQIENLKGWMHENQDGKASDSRRV